jgi:hypothetical protein
VLNSGAPHPVALRPDVYTVACLLRHERTGL